VDIYAEGIKPETLNRQELATHLRQAEQRYTAKEQIIGPEAMRYHSA